MINTSSNSLANAWTQPLCTTIRRSLPAIIHPWTSHPSKASKQPRSFILKALWHQYLNSRNKTSRQQTRTLARISHIWTARQPQQERARIRLTPCISKKRVQTSKWIIKSCSRSLRPRRRHPLLPTGAICRWRPWPTHSRRRYLSTVRSESFRSKRASSRISKPSSSRKEVSNPHLRQRHQRPRLSSSTRWEVALAAPPWQPCKTQATATASQTWAP